MALKNWVEGLKDYGVNLRDYGAKETELHDQKLTCWDFHHYEDLRLTNFTYGESWSDWSFELKKIEEQSNPVTEDVQQHIPGGWVEETTS
ncbi:hypothetical protein MMC28_011669 [Mycoblastus sanguinarius]|nr:hypothetical protein [Mycoblastus sanguinarius]